MATTPARKARGRSKAPEAVPELDIEDILDEEAVDDEVVESDPPSYAIDAEERKELEEAWEIIDSSIDVENQIALAQDILTRLPTCVDISPADGEPHNMPRVDVECAARDQTKIARALLTVENLRRFRRGGFVPRVAYRGAKKGELRTVVRDSKGYTVETFDRVDIVSMLEEAACWMKFSPKRGWVHKEPPAAVKSQVATLQVPYPVLRSVVSAPRWSFDGERFSLAASVGYDPATATFVGKDFNIGRSIEPSDADVKKALATFDDLFGEFPYADEASRRNAYAFLLTMPLRNLITTAPLFIVSAAEPGLGKTLLAETATAATFGILPEPWVLAYKEGEQERRNITAMLRDAPQHHDVTWWDEPVEAKRKGEIASATLNRLATAAAGAYVDRPVMQRESISINVQRTMVFSGNNLHFNAELNRRIVRVSLERNGGKFSRTEDELREHAVQSQEAFHQAVATLIDNWVAKGCPGPTGSEQFPSFNAWLHIVGGILEAAGIVGLRQNPSTVGPYTRARFEWLKWMHDLGTLDNGVVTLPHSEIVTALTDMTPVRRKKVLAMVEGLSFHASSDDTRVWDNLDTAIRDGGGSISSRISKAMQACLVFESTICDDQQMTVKRLENSGKTPLSYRFTMTGKKLDLRGGQRAGAGRPRRVKP